LLCVNSKPTRLTKKCFLITRLPAP